MKKNIVTIEIINDELCSLDTEYREALAHCLVNKKYLSDTPLNLFFGTDKQRKELEEVNKKPLKANQIKEIISYILNEMKGDFQFNEFKPIAIKYINISNKMEHESEQELE